MKDSFANRLAKALDNKGWRAVDLYNATGISKPRISQYLSGAYEAKEEALKKIAEVLNVNEVWLMGYDVDPSRKNALIKNDEVDSDTSVAEDNGFVTLAAHISGELGLTEEMAKKVIEIAKTLRDLK